MKNKRREAGKVGRGVHHRSDIYPGDGVGRESLTPQDNFKKGLVNHWEVLEPKSPIRGVLGVIEMNLNLFFTLLCSILDGEQPGGHMTSVLIKQWTQRANS